MNDLTICSTSFHSAPYLDLNQKLLLGSYKEWLVIQNSGEEKYKGNFKLLSGVPPPKLKPGFVGQASYHHGAALNSALPHIKTRYILFLDPDFFVFPPIDFFFSYLKENDLVAFGAPYEIENKKRIQDIPVAFCLLLDLDKIPPEKLNFVPDNLENVIADTGYYIYEYFKECKTDISVPSYLGQSEFKHTKLSLEKCGIKTKHTYDQYFWQNTPFGIHCHMKLHLRNDKELAERTKAHLQEVESIFKKVRYDFPF